MDPQHREKYQNWWHDLGNGNEPDMKVESPCLGNKPSAKDQKVVLQGQELQRRQQDPGGTKKLFRRLQALFNTCYQDIKITLSAPKTWEISGTESLFFSSFYSLGSLGKEQ